LLTFHHSPLNVNYLVDNKNKKMPANRMVEKLRKIEVPIIVRMDKDEILIDLRTVAEDKFGFIVEGLRQILANQ